MADRRRITVDANEAAAAVAYRVSEAIARARDISHGVALTCEAAADVGLVTRSVPRTRGSAHGLRGSGAACEKEPG